METIIITYAVAGVVMSIISSAVIAISASLEKEERKREEAELVRRQIEIEQKYKENAEARIALENKTR